MTNSQQLQGNNSYQSFQRQPLNQNQNSSDQPLFQSSTCSSQVVNNLFSSKSYISQTQNSCEKYEMNIPQIFKFLRNSGYVATTDTLLSEMNSDRRFKKNIFEHKCTDTDIEEIIGNSQKKKKIEEHILLNKYSKFRNWVLNSLSSVREELFSICFFVFIQIYLTLLKGKRSDFYKYFFNKFYDDFSLSKHKEIINLLRISNEVEQLKDIDLIKPYFESKFHIILKPISFSLLNHYLLTFEDTFIIGIIQEKLVTHLCEIESNNNFSFIKNNIEELNYSQEIGHFQIGELYSEDSLLVEINSKFSRKTDNLQDSTSKEIKISNEMSFSGKGIGLSRSTINWGLFPENYNGIISKDIEIKKSRFDRFDREITEELKDSIEIDFLPINDLNNPFTLEYKKQLFEDVSNRQYVDLNQLPSIISNSLTCLDQCEIVDMSVSHTHELGAFSTNDGCIQVYDIRNPENKINPSWIHRNRVQCVKFHPWNQEFLLSGGIDSNIKLCMVTKNGNEANLTQIVNFHGHSSNSCIWDLNWDNYGISFVSGSSDQTARLWCTSRTHPIRIFNGHLGDVRSVTIHPNCSIVATGGSDNQILIWDVRTGKREGYIHNQKVMSGIINQVKFSHNGYLLASSSIYDPLSKLYSQNQLELPIWDIRKLNSSFGFSTKYYQLCTLPNEITNSNERIFVKSIDFSFGSRILASATNNAIVSLWDTNLSTSFDQTEQLNKESNSIQIYKLRNFNTKNLRFLPRNLLSISSVKLKIFK